MAVNVGQVMFKDSNKISMVRLTGYAKIRDKISSDSLLDKPCLKYVDVTLRTNCLRWFDHVCRSDSWIKKCSQYKMAGKREHVRPRKVWQQCVNCDLKSLKLSKDITSNGNAWRETLRMVESPTHKKC